MKKGLSLILSVLMVLSTLPCLSVVSFAGSFNTTVELNQTLTLNAADTCSVYFTPEKDGYYEFYSWSDEGDEDSGFYIDCSLYGEGGESINSDGDYGTVYMKEYLKAGIKYVFCLEIAENDSNIVEYYATIEESVTATSISFNVNPTITLVEELLGEWGVRYNDEIQEEEEYFEYYVNLSDIFKKGDIATVEYSNGEVIEYYFDGWDFYDKTQNYLYIDVLYDQYKSPWVIGKDNKVTVCVDNATYSFDVEIIEDPVKYVEFLPVEPIVLDECESGWYIEAWDEDSQEWVESDIFYYSYRERLYREGNQLIYHYKDGSVNVYNCRKYYTDDEEDFYYEYYNENGETLWINYFYDSQEDGEVWTAGNTYDACILLSDGHVAELEIEIASGWYKSKNKTVNITGVSNVSNGVKLTWDSLIGATGYIVYYKSSSGKWERLGTTTGTSYIDKTVKSGATRTYTVKAYNTTDGVTT
ncbi:MAG: hypothetical protein ACI4IF_07715, partial [Acutalibacteraceae bacterium]